MKHCVLLRLCWLFAVLAALPIVLAHRSGAFAEEHLHPHAERQSGPWGYVDKTGRVVVPLQFEAAESFLEGLAAVRLNKKSGFIDRTGQFVIQPRFDMVRSFQSGRASMKVGDGWGFIDRSGAEIVPPGYAATWSFNGEYAPVRVKGGRTGAIDRFGQMVVAPEFQAIGTISEGLASAQFSGKYGYIDKAGRVVIPFQFERAFAFRDGRAAVFQGADGRSGFIDKKGTLVIPFDFTMVYEFSEGLAVVADKNRRFGAIDANGQIVISPQFTHVGAAESEWDFRKAFMFSEGFLPVHDGHAFGYIDRQGRYVIEPQFARAGPFREGLAVVHMDAKVAFGPAARGQQLAGLIDRSGKFVVPPMYDWARPKPGGVVQVKFGDRLGYLDSNGRPLTFTEKDIQEHLAQRRELLKPPPPPPPGRAIVGKAGDTEYYLHLPEGMCALDANLPQDRKFIEDLRARGTAELEAAKQRMPQLAEKTWSHLNNTDDMFKANSGLIFKCDQLERARSGGDWQDIRTYVVANGMQKDRYDRSAGAGLVYMSAIMCRMMDRDSAGVPRPPRSNEDHSARVWTAFKQLEVGERTALPALASEALACYSAWVTPSAADKGAAPQARAKAEVRFHTMSVLPDWLVQIITETSAESPEALFRALDREKALVRAFEDANLKKPTPVARP